MSGGDVGVGVGVGVGTGVGAGMGLVFGGSVGGSAGVTDGVTGVGIVGAGDGGVDGVGVQPNSSANINTDMTKRFHFIIAS